MPTSSAFEPVRSRWKPYPYIAAVTLVALTVAGAWFAGVRLASANLAMLFIAPVLLSALAGGLGPAVLAALAAAVSFNFFFIEPRFTFWIERPADLVTFVMFFAVAAATGGLAGRARDEARAARRQAAAVSALLDASRTLAAATTADTVAQALADQVMAAGAGAAVVLLPSQDGLRVAGAPAGLDRLGAAAQGAAEQVMKGGAPAQDAGSDTGWRFQVLTGSKGPVGVVGLRGAPSVVAAQDEALVAALLRQGAVALERAAFSAAAAENEALRRADELRTSLLNSVSHDFRTPLSTVLGSATTLLDYGDRLKPAVRRDLLQSIGESAERLNRYVGDLLDMARLEAGALRPRKERVDLSEVIAQAIERLGPRRGQRRIEQVSSAKSLLIELDPMLTEQVLSNILENAAAYSPEGSTIRIETEDAGRGLVLSVEDEGPGIAPEALEGVFSKFRRLPGSTGRSQGLGLGLSIARGFIEAQGGTIRALNRPGGGARFEVSFPGSPKPESDEP